MNNGATRDNDCYNADYGNVVIVTAPASCRILINAAIGTNVVSPRFPVSNHLVRAVVMVPCNHFSAGN